MSPSLPQIAHFFLPPCFPTWKSLRVFHFTRSEDENATQYLINTMEPRYLIRSQPRTRLWAKWRMGGRDEDASAGPWGLLARLSLVSIRLRAQHPLEESNLFWPRASDLRLTCKLSLFCASTRLGSTSDTVSGVSSVIPVAVYENKTLPPHAPAV